MLKSLHPRFVISGRIGFVALASFLMLGSSRADAPVDQIDRIEEDWEMNLIEPDPENHSPQVTFFVNPNASQSATFFQVQMNYATDASFSGGGFHVAAVVGDDYVDQARSGNRRGLSIDRDTITWTNVMAIFDGQLFFAIKDGYCADWGTFGGPEFLVRMPAAGTTSLNGYHPTHSLEEVDIGFGSNRVASIELKTVRVYYRDGRIVSVPVGQLVAR